MNAEVPLKVYDSSNNEIASGDNILDFGELEPDFFRRGVRKYPSYVFHQKRDAMLRWRQWVENDEVFIVLFIVSCKQSFAGQSIGNLSSNWLRSFYDADILGAREMSITQFGA